jgi:hypothetical protein
MMPSMLEEDTAVGLLHICRTPIPPEKKNICITKRIEWLRAGVILSLTPENVEKILNKSRNVFS